MTQSDYRKTLENLILTVVHEGASDLHLVVGRHPTIRVSGELVPLVKMPELVSDDTRGILKELLDEQSHTMFLEIVFKSFKE